MKTLKITDDGKLAITNGRPTFLSDADAVAQLISLRLRSFKGEWFLNTEAGVPYFQTIFKKTTAIETVSAILKQVILNTVGVLSIDSFDVEFNTTTRKFSFTNCKIIAQSGTIILNEVI